MVERDLKVVYFYSKISEMLRFAISFWLLSPWCLMGQNLTEEQFCEKGRIKSFGPDNNVNNYMPVGKYWFTSSKLEGLFHCYLYHKISHKRQFCI